LTAPDADRRAEPDWQGLTNLKKPAKDRVFRGPTGRVTVALKKAVGVGAILELLRDGELSAGEISRRLGRRFAGVSHHLSSLRFLGLERALFLDLETCGLASSPVFLAGTMHWNGEDFVLRQYFARHYGEEAALLAAVSDHARGFEALVTFNGKAYDAPFLTARALTHGVELQLPRHHLDLLHHARRQWREELPDCRLTTLEWRVCRRRRVGDVPGDQIPGLYHDYVRNGDPWRLVPVFHHNLLDVTTMADILHTLCKGRKPREPDAPYTMS